MEEGLATYVEPVVRCRAGLLTPEAAWDGFRQAMPQGLPGVEDHGLDRLADLGRRQSWGRTYWGGALYWLMADVELLEKTEGRVGLDDLLRGTVREGDIRTRWELSQLLDVAERVSGVPVLRDLHTRLAEAPGRPDLDSLWRRLGIGENEGKTVFDDGAPLAWVRDRIMHGRTSRATR
jgi:predicted metalloprotease with PDZ domain